MDATFAVPSARPSQYNPIRPAGPTQTPGTGREPGSSRASGPGAAHQGHVAGPANKALGSKKKSRSAASDANAKRKCVSTACVACRKRKSKCDGALPSCAACASVYGTECLYDPNSDHRRRGVYREKNDTLKAGESTLQVLIEAILNADEDQVPSIVRRIRTCDSLDLVANQLLTEQADAENGEASDLEDDEYHTDMPAGGEKDLASKMGELRLESGAVRFIGGTSHLLFVGDPNADHDLDPGPEIYSTGEDPILTWTRVTNDTELITHLMDMYFNYHYAYFTTLSKKLFLRDFHAGRGGLEPGTPYCSSLLVNAMLALGCHFTSVSGAYAIPGDSRSKGDHFFAEAKRLIVENDEYERPRLVTVQALALMSVREAGCGREGKGWVYSGMSFRMAQDIGLNLEISGLEQERLSDDEIDARRITFWGCFLFDKCWSNYLGRLPQLPKNSFNVSRIDVFPEEDAALWSPLTMEGFDASSEQPARTRASAYQLFKLCEISSDLLLFFYHPNHIGRSSGKAVELKKLSELHQRLEEWRRDLPKEFEPKDNQLPDVILMHMFFHLQYIHLFRPFLKYAPTASPLPAHVSPRRICTANAGSISKLMRLYKKSWGLRQICNIAVYMTHSACIIHLLNLPEKTAKRDITHGVRHLEEIAEDWLCARRTLSILSVLSRKWKCELPDDAAFVLRRTDEKYGSYSMSEVPSPRSQASALTPTADSHECPKREYSPVTQYTSNHLASQVQAHQTSSLDDRMMNVPVHMLDGFAAPSQDMPVDITPMGFGADALANWSPTSLTGGIASAPGHAASISAAVPAPLSRQSPVNYAPAYPHLSQGGEQVPVVSRHVSPGMPSGAGPSVDGQDWFLNDSVRWHQGFESWDGSNAHHAGAVASGPAAASSMFVFGDNGHSSPVSPTHPANTEHAPAFDGLHASLNDPGWLPNLE